MKAMILAAGLGTRLRPLTRNIPKPLVPVMGTPLILHNLLFLKKHGIDEVIINLHYLPRMIPDYLGDGSSWGLKLQYSEESDILGTAGGIWKAREYLSGDTFVVMNADSLIEVDLSHAISAHRKNGAISTMIVSDKPDSSRYGVVGLDKDGRVRRITEHVGGNLTGLKQTVFLGIHIIEPEIFKHFPQETQTPSCINAEVYPEIIRSGGPIYAYLQPEGYWSDLGTPVDYLQAHWDILDGKLILPHLPPSQNNSTADLIGPVYIGSGVTIGEGSVVGPYCVIGDNVKIANNCRITGSVIWEGAQISEETKITDSVVTGVIRSGIYGEKFVTSKEIHHLSLSS